ncbi:MAG: hypothetical protein IJY73_02265 [Oscillospiraceae bacterium]|nr:hypothetical protein [Oscillospiraceae bacterium]
MSESSLSNLERIQGIEMNNQVGIEINTTPDAETGSYASLCDMFKSYGLALNEQIYEAMYLADQGYGSSSVTGLKPVLNLTGDYNPNDPACQYLNEAQWKIGKGRVTDIKLTRGGQVITCSATMVGIGIVGGESAAPNGVNLILNFNGKPTVTPVTETTSTTATTTTTTSGDEPENTEGTETT